eukprot:8804366-Alexandrium_andersonii.AAC.1
MQQCEAGMNEIEAVVEAKISDSEAEKSEMAQCSSQLQRPLDHGPFKYCEESEAEMSESEDECEPEDEANDHYKQKIKDEHEKS